MSPSHPSLCIVIQEKKNAVQKKYLSTLQLFYLSTQEPKLHTGRIKQVTRRHFNPLPLSPYFPLPLTLTEKKYDASNISATHCKRRFVLHLVIFFQLLLRQQSIWDKLSSEFDFCRNSATFFSSPLRTWTWIWLRPGTSLSSL